MIDLPDFSQAFFYENGFYLSCDNSRIGKLIAHYELFRMSENVPGAIVECGVFRGASLMRFAAFRDLFGQSGKRILGFDTFGAFPETEFEDDKRVRANFVGETGDGHSIPREQLEAALRHKQVGNYELCQGNITETVPRYVERNPELTISLLNLDVDIYEPSVTVLESLYPRISKNGILILDDYNSFPGETQAVNEYFEGRDAEIRRFPYSRTPYYIKKL